METQVQGQGEQPRVGWGAWPRWILATTAGALGPGVLATLLLHATITLHSFLAELACLPVLLCFGFPVGLAQWLVLRTVTPQVDWRRWVSMSGLGWFVGHAVGLMVGVSISYAAGHVVPAGMLAVPGPQGAIIGSLVVGVVTGLVVGLSQAFVLRGEITDTARLWTLWPIINAVAWGLGFPIALLMSDITLLPEEIYALRLAASFAGCGAISATITGGTLVLMLRSRSR